VYANLERLREIVDENIDSDEMRELFEYHRNRIAAVVDRPDVPATTTTVAGFLNGFLTAARTLAQEPEAMADTIHPYLGGIYLYAEQTLGRHVPSGDGSEFIDRLAGTLRHEPERLVLTDQQRALAIALVTEAFAETPDVPVNPASLAGFALGVLYAAPFIAGSPGTATAALFEAVTTLARRGAT
jgi:hypothetical protein